MTMSTREIPLPAPVTGLSYRRPAAAMATVLTLAVFSYASHLATASAGLPTVLVLILAAGGAAMAAGCWFVVFGTTSVDAEGIRRAGLLPRSWHWTDIEQAQLVRMPWSTGLLLATRRDGEQVVHAGTPALEEAFRIIAEIYSRRGH